MTATRDRLRIIARKQPPGARHFAARRYNGEISPERRAVQAERGRLKKAPQK